MPERQQQASRTDLDQRNEEGKEWGYNEHDDSDDLRDNEYDEYDDFAACFGGGGGGGGGGIGRQKTAKRQKQRGGGGSGTIYSSKHIRAKESLAAKGKKAPTTR